MAIKDKAQAYDKAIKVIKDNLDALNEITETGAEAVNIQAIKNCFYRAFPELKDKESEDDKIRKWCINLIKTTCDYDSPTSRKEVDDAIAWLEKQGKQNLPSVNERAWLYLVSDVLTWKDGIGQYLDDPRVQKLAKELCSEYAQKLYSSPILSNEQKGTDKVEPKFHEGDWITIKE